MFSLHNWSNYFLTDIIRRSVSGIMEWPISRGQKRSNPILKFDIVVAIAHNGGVSKLN